MPECHPDRPHHAKGLCQQCYHAEYRATHKEERRANGAIYEATHKQERRTYIAANRERIATRKAAYDASHKDCPAARAAHFLVRTPDCTSTLEEVTAIYAASIDLTTGLPGKVGLRSTDLVLDHVHDAQAIGLVPVWLNHLCTRHLERDGNFDLLLRHLERRQAARIDRDLSRYLAD